MSETRLRLLAGTTSRQHLHASDMASPNCGCGEEPSSLLNKFLPNSSLTEGMGWWPPAPGCSISTLLKGESTLPFLPTSLPPPFRPETGQHRALPETKPQLRDTGKQQCSGCSLRNRAHVVPNSIQPPGTTAQHRGRAAPRLCSQSHPGRSHLHGESKKTCFIL